MGRTTLKMEITALKSFDFKIYHSVALKGLRSKALFIYSHAYRIVTQATLKHKGQVTYVYMKRQMILSKPYSIVCLSRSDI